jgi:hypothetical protein
MENTQTIATLERLTVDGMLEQADHVASLFEQVIRYTSIPANVSSLKLKSTFVPNLIYNYEVHISTLSIFKTLRNDSEEYYVHLSDFLRFAQASIDQYWHILAL